MLEINLAKITRNLPGGEKESFPMLGVVPGEGAGAGEPGKDGKDGHSPYIGDNGNWYIYDDAQQEYVDSGKPSRGEAGKDGADGATGPQGPAGSGESAVISGSTDDLTPTQVLEALTSGKIVNITTTVSYNGQSLEVVSTNLSAIPGLRNVFAAVVYVDKSTTPPSMVQSVLYGNAYTDVWSTFTKNLGAVS